MTLVGFEPSISALRGQYPRPLDDRAKLLESIEICNAFALFADITNDAPHTANGSLKNGILEVTPNGSKILFRTFCVLLPELSISFLLNIIF